MKRQAHDKGATRGLLRKNSRLLLPRATALPAQDIRRWAGYCAAGQGQPPLGGQPPLLSTSRVLGIKSFLFQIFSAAALVSGLVR